MEGTPSESRANSTFTFDPTNMVVGVIDNADATKNALRDLIADGLSEKKIALLTDEEAARRISANDEWSEVSVHMFRSTQKLPAFYRARNREAARARVARRSSLDWSDRQGRGNAHASM